MMYSFSNSELSKCSWVDVGLKRWMIYYNDLYLKKNGHSFFKLIYLLKNNGEQLDVSDGNIFDCDDFRFSIYPNLGFLEKYFLVFINDEKTRFEEAGTALMLAIFYGITFSEIKLSIYSKSLNEVIEKAFLESRHEIFGIDEVKLLKVMLNKKIIDKKSMMYLSVLRGVVLGKRYLGFKNKFMLWMKKIFFYIYVKLI